MFDPAYTCAVCGNALDWDQWCDFCDAPGGEGPRSNVWEDHGDEPENDDEPEEWYHDF